MKKIKISTFVFFLISFLVIFNINIFAEMIGHIEESAISVYDEEGNYVFATAMGVSIDDRYLSEDNVEYLVVAVNGNRAVAENKGKIDLLAGINSDIDARSNTLSPLAAQGSKKIGIYHTHNGESYLPGPENISEVGEIHEIGNIFKEALESHGIEVAKLNNLHLPHDGAAYERSRGTATDLVRENPDAIFDVHRDAIPRKEEYLKNINGKTVSQVRLVVGRQNPNQKVNDQFARNLKSVADEQYPGLIKGIFYGRGNYNQQISPHSLLLEFGTHVTTKEQAAASAEMLADSINQLLYGSGELQTRGRTAENRSIVSTIAWIVGIVIVGLLGFLFINEGSFEGVKNRIKKFFGREIIDKGDR